MGVIKGTKRGPYNSSKTRISKTDERTLALEVRKIVAEKFMKEDFKEEVNTLRRKAAAFSRSRYVGMLHGVKELLNAPAASHFYLGGVHTRNLNVKYFKAPEGSVPGERIVVNSGRAGVAPWRRLSMEYIEENPRSMTYWRKTGILSKLYSSYLTASEATFTALNRYSKAQVKESAVEKRGAPARKFTFALYFPALHPAIDKLLRVAFISGRAQSDFTVKDEGSLAVTLYRIQPPEAKRPWLSRFAAVMGRIFYENLKKL